jgi:hypothetical protein
LSSLQCEQCQMVNGRSRIVNEDTKTKD